MITSRQPNKPPSAGLNMPLRAGLLLIEAKSLVAHGEWLPWLQANCKTGERQARTYMRLARYRITLEKWPTNNCFT